MQGTMQHDPRRAAVAELARMIAGIDVAMFTSVAADGRLVSRPFGTQQGEFDGELWFVCAEGSAVLAEITQEPRVNLAYVAPERNTYVSVAGRAQQVCDRARAAALWSPAMARFFPGGVDDPALCLIRVCAESAEYWDAPAGLFGRALEFVMGAVDPAPEALSENRLVDLRPPR